MNNSVKIIALLALSFISPSFAMEKTKQQQPRSFFSYIASATKKYMGYASNTAQQKYNKNGIEQKSSSWSVASKLGLSGLWNWFTKKPVKVEPTIVDLSLELKKYNYLANLKQQCFQGNKSLNCVKNDFKNKSEVQKSLTELQSKVNQQIDVADKKINSIHDAIIHSEIVRFENEYKQLENESRKCERFLKTKTSKLSNELLQKHLKNIENKKSNNQIILNKLKQSDAFDLPIVEIK